MDPDHLARSTAGAGSGRRTVGTATRPSPPSDRRTLHSVPRFSPPPVTVLVVTGQGVVTAGIAAVMAGVAHVSVRGSTGGPLPAGEVDVVVYDVNGLARGAADLDRLVRRPALPVLALTFEDDSELGRQALARGVDGLLPPGLPVRRIQALVLDAVAQAGWRSPRPTRPAAHLAEPVRTCDDFGLTPRELEVLRLIATGVSNATIAGQTCLSINSIKTYIRSAYRRIGVERRSQAVAWCYQYGLGDVEPADPRAVSGPRAPRDVLDQRA